MSADRRRATGNAEDREIQIGESIRASDLAVCALVEFGFGKRYIKVRELVTNGGLR